MIQQKRKCGSAGSYQGTLWLAGTRSEIWTSVEYWTSRNRFAPRSGRQIRDGTYARRSLRQQTALAYEHSTRVWITWCICICMGRWLELCGPLNRAPKRQWLNPIRMNRFIVNRASPTLRFLGQSRSRIDPIRVPVGPRALPAACRFWTEHARREDSSLN